MAAARVQVRGRRRGQPPSVRPRVLSPLASMPAEEPFSILPLEKICDTIESNVWELHATHSVTGAAAPPQGQPWPQVDSDRLVADVTLPAFRW